MQLYTILQYIEFNGFTDTIPVGFFVDKKDRDDALSKNFFFTNDNRLPSKESIQKNRWATRGIVEV